MVSILCSFVILAKGPNQGLDPNVLRFRFHNIVRNSHRLKKTESANVAQEISEEQCTYERPQLPGQNNGTIFTSSFHMPRKCKSESATRFSNLQFQLKGSFLKTVKQKLKKNFHGCLSQVQ